MVVVSVEEAQKRLADLLAVVVGGEEVVNSKNDVPISRIVAMPTQEPYQSPRIFGQFAGRIHIADDFDAPLEDFAEYN
jgi:antitoxin (DNA-binding transcriptional repressor) of toxin-antitoxin stability system